MRCKKTDLAYFAGIVDGEGAISICRKLNPKRQDGTHLYTCVLQVGMTKPEAIRALQTAFGGRVYRAKARKANHSPVFYWRIEANGAASVLRQLVPFLRIKQRQALLAQKFQAHVNQRRPFYTSGQTFNTKRLTQTDLGTRARFYSACKRLNQRGQNA